MINPFSGRRYVVVNWENVPSGLNNNDKRVTRKSINANIGNQSNRLPHKKTGHRKDLPTIWNEENEITQTAGKALYGFDSNLTDSELIEEIEKDLSRETGWPVGIVISKFGIILLGNQQAMLNYLAVNKAEWGE